MFEVNKTGYDNCTIEGATGNWTSGKDFILLTKAQRYYFICGTGGCFTGMKVSVLVHNLPSPPRAAMAAQHATGSTAARGGGVVGVVLGVFLSFWFGCGWI